jgi:hypothetical protein
MVLLVWLGQQGAGVVGEGLGVEGRGVDAAELVHPVLRLGWGRTVPVRVGPVEEIDVPDVLTGSVLAKTEQLGQHFSARLQDSSGFLVSLTTVKSQAARGLQTLRELLNEDVTA